MKQAIYFHYTTNENIYRFLREIACRLFIYATSGATHRKSE